MKKRITALLLCLVMVFSLIPTTVWAAAADVSTHKLDTGHSISVRFTVLYVGDEFRIGYNTGASESTTFVCQYSQPHSDTAYTNHTIAISDIKAAAGRATVNTGYQIVGWSKECNENPKTWGFNLKDPTACNKGTTIYLVAKDSTPATKYTLNYDANGGTGAPGSQTGSSKTSYYDFTISETVPTKAGYDFQGWSTVQNGKAAYQPGGTFRATATSTTLYAVWENHTHKDNDGDGFCDKDQNCMHSHDKDGYCTVEGCTHPNTCCPKREDPKPPTEPTGKPNFTDVNGQIRVQCTAYPSNHEPHAYQYKITDGSYTDNGWTHEGDAYTYSIILNRASFIKKFDTDTKWEHKDDEPNAVTTVTWRWDNNKWVLIPGPDGITADIKCICDKEIVPPTDGPSEDDVKAALGNLTVKCVNGPKTGSNCTPCVWPAKLGYTGKDSLTKVSDTEYTVELGVDVFVNAYTKRAGEEHGLMSAATLTWVLAFDKESGKWVGEPKEAGVDDVIRVAHRVPVHVVIYRNGDTTKAYKDIALNSELPGTVIDLTKLKIADYYTGDVEFYGWYNDGTWNTYKKNVAAGKDAPAGLKEIKVNGWTNIICMVYDLDKVVYFQSAEDLAAYQKDHSKTDGLLYTTTVRRGTALPTADAPTATREGYTFQYWSREGQNKDVTGQTVSGWTNLYAQWEIASHDIYAYAHVNSTFAPLTKDEYDNPVTLNAATLSRLGLGSYNTLGYISIGVLKNFDKMALTDDYFGDDAELAAVVEELAKSIVLEQGVSKDTAKKIAWTALYRKDNGISMDPGYPTADANGYQLSGNLNLATVMFAAGANDVEDMPAVNYTYDDIIDIYDFYFAGDTFTLPTDPTRTGYTFQGWSAEVIPADNDAECNDADTDADADTEKLYKAGDTYEITGGGVKFTAQWAKKDYVISATLYLNGADKEHPVMVDDGRYPWSHRYGGKFEETISYDEMFKALKDRAMEVDAANGPVDSVVTLCFPGDYPATAKKLFNETILTYGQDGGGWNPNNKNTAPIWGFATNVYAVTFDYKIEGNTDVNTTLKVNYNEQVAEPESLTRTGYTFKGWYTDADCTEDNEFVFTTPITKSMTLYAKWQVNQYKVTYDANGGVKADPSEAMVDFGAKVPNSTTTREGYTFQGWFVGDTDVKWDFEKDTMGAEAMTLTAHWQANEYTVTFNANGGVDADPESKTVTYDAEYGTLAETSREGYTFLGWFTEKDGGDEVEETTIVKTAEDHTLYAHWQINVYTVKFVSFDKVVETQEVEHGKTATRIKNPEVNDYVFKGWYLNGQLYDFNTPVTSDITLVAQWVTKTPSSNPSTPTKTETKDNGKTVQSGKTFDGGIALYVGLSVLSATGSAWVITKKKRG